jgi:hypothetical protein
MKNYIALDLHELTVLDMFVYDHVKKLLLSNTVQQVLSGTTVYVEVENWRFVAMHPECEALSKTALSSSLRRLVNKRLLARLNSSSMYGLTEISYQLEGITEVVPHKKEKEKVGEKKSREEIIKEKKQAFQDSIHEFIKANPNKYTNDMYNKFYQYWSEPLIKGAGLRWEENVSWSLSGRLAKWHSNNKEIIPQMPPRINQ